jgi:hypothetical protein
MTIARPYRANVLFTALCSITLSISAGAQSATISFDALPRAKRDTVVPARKRVTPVTSATSVSAVRVARVDTVRITRVDTVKTAVTVPVVAATPAPQPVKAAPAKAAAPTFAPPSVTGLLQVMLTGGDSALRSTYRIRRAEVKVTSDLGAHAQAIIMVDVAKALSLSTSNAQTSVTQSSRVLQDAIISMAVWRLRLDAGQQRLPLGYEGSMSSSGLETVERALMESDKSRGGSFGDVRDLGVAARGSWRSLDYRAGLFNGSGETMNDVDKNVAKSAAGRLDWRVPFFDGLRIGASGVTSGPATVDKPTRDRVGADVRYVRGPALIQSEAMAGRDGATVRHGMYALAAVAVRPGLKVIARFDAWDPDARKESTPADVTERDYLAGLTWFPGGTRLKLQAALVHKTYSNAITPSVTAALTQLQASW